VLSGGVDIFSIKIFRTGLSVSRDIVGLALALNRQCMIGGQGETHLGAAISAHFSSALRERGCAPYPAETSTSYRYDFNLLGQRPEFRDGKMVLSAKPGLGVELDFDVVKMLSKGTEDPTGKWIRLL
jgi:L-alanine-DL-glutamate epimerase-like enolase superfamily enzyme